jgi:hypothetical protein
VERAAVVGEEDHCLLTPCACWDEEDDNVVKNKSEKVRAGFCWAGPEEERRRRAAGEKEKGQRGVRPVRGVRV